MHRLLIPHFLFAFYSGYAAALGPWAQHLTEPDHRSSLIDILHLPTETSHLVEDSCIFITPYISDFVGGSFGPQIFKADGTLVWNGNYTAKVRAMDAHICDYLGVIGNHICYNDAQPVEQAGHSAGAIRFFDNTYTQVGPDYGAEGDLRAPDIHELNTPGGQKGETFIQDIYEIKRMNLAAYNGPEFGYVLDGCFQEVEIRTKKILFQWCALDHLPVYDTYLYLYGVDSSNYSMPITGNGEIDAPWDFFHINAIARNLEGDYAISARHLDTIFKIAGKDNAHGVEPGTILWRLGGKHNEFQMDFNFSRQHTVRFHSVGSSSSVISFFDNAYDGWARTSDSSSGKMVHVDNSTMTATLITQYLDPEEDVSFSQGSLQLLDNGNVLIGWGNRPSFSEYTIDGQLLSHGNYSGGVESFRVWKFPWKGFPTYPPKLLAYAENCSAPLYAYASWNGATEVAAWSFHASWGTQHGPWHHMGTVPTEGFETFVNFTALNSADPVGTHAIATSPVKGRAYSNYAPYMYVSALDASGQVLGSSNVGHTFVPKNATVALEFNCTTHLCEAEYFRFEESLSCGATCARDHTAAAWFVVAFICAVELSILAAERFGRQYLSGTSRTHLYTGVDAQEEEDDDDDWDRDWDDVDSDTVPSYDRIQVGKRRHHGREKFSYADGYKGNIDSPISQPFSYIDGADDYVNDIASPPHSRTPAFPPRQTSLANCNRPTRDTTGNLASGLGNLLALFGLGTGAGPSPRSTALPGRGRASKLARSVSIPETEEPSARTRVSRSGSESHRRVVSERTVGLVSAPVSSPRANEALGRVRASGTALWGNG